MPNLIDHEQDIDELSFHAKDPYEANCKLLIGKRESTGLKYLNDSKTFWNTQIKRMIFTKVLKDKVHRKKWKILN